MHRKGKVNCKGPPGGFRSGQVKRGHPPHRQARWRHTKVHMQVSFFYNRRLHVELAQMILACPGLCTPKPS